MSRARIWAVRVGLVLLALIAVLAVLWAISRALYPTEAQRRALALMQQTDPPEGNNAFAALWTLARAVPAGDMPDVIERDAARIAQLPGLAGFAEPLGPPFASAAEDYRDLAPSPEDRALFCRFNPGGDHADCIERVRTDRTEYRALIERNRELLDRIAALSDYQFIRQQLPWNHGASLLVPTRAGLLATRHAVWFADGRVDAALAGTCRGIETWRRLGATGDTLILRLTANALSTRQHGALLAEMLVELDLDYPLPPICERALAAPAPRELSLCPAMRGEFELISQTTGLLFEQYNSRTWPTSVVSFLARDAEATEALHAQVLAPVCAGPEGQRIAADNPEIPQSGPKSVWRFECLGNFIGCVTTGITAGAYSHYRLRMQDYGARLKLLGALVEARAGARGDPQRTARALERRLTRLSHAHRTFEPSPDGDAIRVELFEPRNEPHWSIPVPAPIAVQLARNAEAGGQRR